MNKFTLFGILAVISAAFLLQSVESNPVRDNSENKEKEHKMPANWCGTFPRAAEKPSGEEVEEVTPVICIFPGHFENNSTTAKPTEEKEEKEEEVTPVICPYPFGSSTE